MPQERPFPAFRPTIRIEPSAEEPFRVDFRELAWWFSVPVVGDEVRWADYECPVAKDGPWKLCSTVSSVSRGPAVIHGRHCVEIECTEHYFDNAGLVRSTIPRSTRRRKPRIWGCLTEEKVEFVAVETESRDGIRELTTVLDEGFDDDWGPGICRSLEDCGHLRQLADGSFSGATDRSSMVAAGMFEVHVDDRSFTCLRVFETDPSATEIDDLIEAYLTREGRTLLLRRYNGNRWGKQDEPPQDWGTELTWMEDLPGAHHIVVDGVAYVHWYDCLTDVTYSIAG